MQLKTSDGVNIAYDWYPAKTPAGYLVLVHMMPATKESWKEFAEAVQKENFSSIAIDLRGHGQSDAGPQGYNAFADEEHQQSIKDLEAALDFLKTQGAESEKITLAGASVGSNLCIWYLSEHPEIKSAVALSAGESYRGIHILPMLAKLQSDQKLLMFASEDDVRSGGSNASVNKRLIEAVPEGVGRELAVFATGGHGTDFLPQATAKILEFLKS
ncbi:MAG: alpha/beta fold hydrolase [bacterium]|nr:alpha/beta fold hydrolase [bacterium]